MKCIDGSRFPLLSAIARLVQILLHSNAGEERIFSMFRKNKTPFRASLALDGTLSSIITTKLANLEPSNTFEPPQKILKTAIKCTTDYNKTHSSANS